VRERVVAASSARTEADRLRVYNADRSAVSALALGIVFPLVFTDRHDST
jgi:hypothetical protein